MKRHTPIDSLGRSDVGTTPENGPSFGKVERFFAGLNCHSFWLLANATPTQKPPSNGVVWLRSVSGHQRLTDLSNDFQAQIERAFKRAFLFY